MTTPQVARWSLATCSPVVRWQLPNESRLSCAAERKSSQTEFYHTACRTFSEFIEDERRQLQARVRRRAPSAFSAEVGIAASDDSTQDENADRKRADAEHNECRILCPPIVESISRQRPETHPQSSKTSDKQQRASNKP